MTKAENDFNHRLRQVTILLLIIAMAIGFLYELAFLFPGFLGAITLYILARPLQDILVKGKGWNKHLSAVLFLVSFTVIVALPFYLAIVILKPRIKTFIGNKDEMIHKAELFSQKIQSTIGIDLVSKENSKQIMTKASNIIPDILNGSALAIGNFALILFLGYFMIVYKDKLEKALSNFIPLKDTNITLLGAETNRMVRANAIGIPLISLIQGLVATIGYWIFGVDDFVVWGFLTGIFAFFPIIGTALIWIPLVLLQFSSGGTGQGIGLLIYSAVVIGNIDYFARITLLRRIGEVHPIITIVGVILGLKLFGFWGFIFGPLLVSYLLLLIKIYNNEFGRLELHEQELKVTSKTKSPRQAAKK